MRRTPLATLIAATIFACGVEVFPVADGALSPAEALADALIALSFVWAGVCAWQRRPENMTGRLMVAVGLTWSLANLMFADAPVLRGVGLMALGVFGAPLAHMLLAFPSGWLRERLDRWVVGAVYVHLTVQWWLILALGLYEALWPAHSAVSAAFALVVFGLLFRRWRAASPPARRALNPVLGTGLAAAVTVCVTAPVAFSIPSEDGALAGPVHLLWAAAFSAVPVGFVVGLLRTRVTRAPLAHLVRELGRPMPPLGLRSALARALGDPSLELGFPAGDGGGYHDAYGRPLRLPHPREGRAITRLHEALLIHDPALRYDQGLLEAVVDAARLALENERLQAELRAQLREVLEARARLVGAQDTERRRIERDLHDGAQQTLVALSLSLRLLAEQIETETARPELSMLACSSAQLAERAVAELRDLARGVYPVRLTEDGLAGALDSLALCSALDVRLDVALGRRAGALAEAAGYFVCSEAVTNAAKHAAGTQVRVRARDADGELEVEVADDGIGGADPSGSGLLGLADRVAALGGSLEVHSPPGHGTVLRARIPFVDVPPAASRSAPALPPAVAPEPPPAGPPDPVAQPVGSAGASAPVP